jgi:glycosyltransferase involved in cell wall biosynthesis
MTDRTPLVTVGVPVYNTGKYLAETLRALQQQELADIEILVADNASTDSSLEIAESFAAEDERFRVLPSEVNRGSTWNYNRLLDTARAPFFMWNSADDIILPSHLSTCRNLLLEHPDAVLAFSRAVAIKEDGTRAHDNDDAGLDFFSAGPVERLRLFLRHRVYYAAFAGLYRTDALRAAGGYAPMYGQDVALAAKLALRSPWVQSQEQSYLERMHSGQARNLQWSDPVEQMRVFNPKHSLPVAFPQWKLNAQLIAEALAAPISLIDRARAVAAVCRHYSLPFWRLLPYDVMRNLVRLIRGRFKGASDAG